MQTRPEKPTPVSTDINSNESQILEFWMWGRKIRDGCKNNLH